MTDTDTTTQQPAAGCIFMYRGDERAQVNFNSVKIMAQLGWAEASTPSGKPSDGLTVPQIKDALEAKSITIPDGVTLKADLAALLDNAPS